MAEETFECPSLDVARNEAIRWLERRGGVRFDQNTVIVIGRLGVFEGAETGVSAPSGQRPWWRIRIDYDPNKGLHYNAEYQSTSGTSKAAFQFPGDLGLAERLAQRRAPR